eukprot:m.332626 g.332626  ORF g.332626 m.332626 type:complete len:280 (-) comp16973_c0_seq1:65-904(-)
MISIDDIEADANSLEIDPKAALKKAERKKKKKKKQVEENRDEEDANDGIVFQDGQLSCAGKDWTEVPRSIAESYGMKARRVDFCYNQLTSLRHVEMFTMCEELVLDNNNLGDSVTFPSLPRLKTLTINKNQISDTDSFLTQVKEAYPNLTFLSLLGNAACPNELVLKDEDDYKRYRYFVLFNLPNLKFLDSRPVTEFERKEADRVGRYTKVVTVTADDMEAEFKRQQAFERKNKQSSQFSPLPTDTRTAENHKGTIGTCKYVYFGRHSEGNRFIRDGDL